MQDSSKYLVIAVAVLALLFLFCTKKRGEMMMTPASSMPDMQMVKPSDPSGGGLMPADHDTTDYGPYPSSSKPCATAAPFA